MNGKLLKISRFQLELSSGEDVIFDVFKKYIMPHYIILWNWTEQGIKNVKDAPKRIAAARDAAEKLGGKVTIYYTIGVYDTVGFAEFPNDETAASYVLSLGSHGNVRSMTLRAFSETEAAGLIANSA